MSRKEDQVYTVLARPGSRACTAFNRMCTDATLHTDDLHVCTYCLVAVERLCVLQEHFC